MENPQCGKNHGSAQATEKIPLYERNTLSRKRRGNDLSSSSSPHAAAVTQSRQRPLSLSLSLSLSLTLSVHLALHLFNNHTYKICALCHIYTHMTVRHIYNSVHPISSVPIGADSAISRFSASCIWLHPEGHVSQQYPRRAKSVARVGNTVPGPYVLRVQCQVTVVSERDRSHGVVKGFTYQTRGTGVKPQSL